MKVAISGGTGTLGRALIARLLKEDHERVVSVSRDEVKAGDLAAAYPHSPQLRTYLGDVRDQARLTEAFQGCDTVIHAAALKRVTESTNSPLEMIKTNVTGTINVISAAKEAGCKRCIIISSDKAVHATNLYGATKFTAECYATQANSYTFPRGLLVACTRYGNVLGSRGSVTEIWKDIPAPHPIPVTDPAMTRYLITQEQAVDFVLNCLAVMQGGEIFIPRLPAITIMQLAEAIYGRDRAIEIIGLRAGGEKVHETLVNDEEWNRLYTVSDQTVAVLPSFRSWSDAPYGYAPAVEDRGALMRSDAASRLTTDQIRELCNGG